MIHVVGWSCICLCVGAEAQACVTTMKANTEVPDEEASQTKALSYMFDTDIVGLCGWEDSDDAHPKWNGFKKSVRQSNLEIAQLKGTVLANWQFTPFNTMKSKHTAQEALQMRLRDETVENPSWYQERGEMITRDRLMSQLQAEEYLDNEEMMKQYIEYIADYWLLKMGHSKLYTSENPFDFMNYISLQSFGNFFETKISSYRKANVGSSAKETEFSLEDDF